MSRGRVMEWEGVGVTIAQGQYCTGKGEQQTIRKKTST